MHNRHELGTPAVERLGYLHRPYNVAPFYLYLHHFSAAARRYISHADSENTVDPNHHFVARLNEIGK